MSGQEDGGGKGRDGEDGKLGRGSKRKGDYMEPITGKSSII